MPLPVMRAKPTELKKVLSLLEAEHNRESFQMRKSLAYVLTAAQSTL